MPVINAGFVDLAGTQTSTTVDVVLPVLAGFVDTALPGHTLVIDVINPVDAGYVDTNLPTHTLVTETTALPAGGTLQVSLWAVDPVTGVLSPLPDWSGIQLSPVANEAGTVTIKYPVNGQGFSTLRAITASDIDVEVAIWLHGRNAGSLRCLLLQASGDDAEEGGEWTFAGHFLEHRMTEALIFNQPAPAENGKLVFSAANAGQIMALLMQQAHARGALADIVYTSFSGAKDSNGTAWTLTANLEFAPGETYLSVLSKLVELDMCEWEVTAKHELKVYISGGRGSDLTLGATPTILRRGRNMLDSPRQHSNRESGTAVLSAGKDGLYREDSDATALARRRRRIERFASSGNLADAGSLAAFGQATLTSIKNGIKQVSHGLVFGAGEALPEIGFHIGDWVYSDATTTLEKLRVVQWSMDIPQNGEPTGGIALNDLIQNRLAALRKRIDQLTSGATVVGASTPPGAEEDKLAPAAPTGLVASSLAYNDGAGGTLASVSLSWSAVTTNSDGSACVDLSGYRVRFRYTAFMQEEINLPAGLTPWLEVAPTDGGATTQTWGDVSGGADIEIQVSAHDWNGNQSAWSAGLLITTQGDLTPPPVPSTPTVTEWLGTIRVAWDGLGSLGEAMPLDFDHVEVHISQAAGFAPDASTFVGNMFGAGRWNRTGLTYGVAYYARLVAVDRSGNLSAGSAAASATPIMVAGADITPLSVLDANIANLDAGKITSGTISADLLLAGIIRTAFSGARSEQDSAGIRLYNQSDLLVVEFKTATGDALITGTIKTALSGERWEMLPDGTARLYPSSGTNYSQIANLGNDVAWRGPLDGNSRSGRINVNSLGVGINFSTEADLGNLWTEMTTFKDRQIHIAPYHVLQVDGLTAHIPPSGVGRAVVFQQTDSSGNVINDGFIGYYRRGGGGGTLNSAAQNCGVVWDANAISITTGTDSTFGPISASAFNVSSSREVKHRIRDIDWSGQRALDLIRAVKAQEFEYVAETAAAETKRPEVTGGKVLEKLRDPITQETIPDQDGRPTEVYRDLEWTAPERTKAPKHYGPMAEDLAAIAPDLIGVHDSTGEPVVSAHDLVGVLWDAVRQLAGEVAALRATP